MQRLWYDNDYDHTGSDLKAPCEFGQGNNDDEGDGYDDSEDCSDVGDYDIMRRRMLHAAIEGQQAMGVWNREVVVEAVQLPGRGYGSQLGDVMKIVEVMMVMMIAMIIFMM